MHTTSHEMMREFVEVHLERHRGTALDIIDFGSQMIGAEQLSYSTLLDDPAWNYRGVDIMPGRNVDVVLDDPYRWSELPSESVDLFVSGQAFEHIEHFWVTIFEVVRVLKPGGLTAIIAPSSGYEHRFPVDCWRFYPDGFSALGRYAQCEVVDSFADWGNGDWADAILVIRKPDWDDDERARFDHRAGLQRLLLSSEPITASRIADEWQYQPQVGSSSVGVSPLADARTGELTSRLELRRNRRVSEEESEATLADLQHRHEAGQASFALDALTADNAQLRARLVEVEAAAAAAHAAAAVPPAHRLYGSARAKVADLVGDRGRSLYKRLRGRS